MDDASGRDQARDANGRFGPATLDGPAARGARMTQRVAISLLRHYEENEDPANPGRL